MNIQNEYDKQLLINKKLDEENRQLKKELKKIESQHAESKKIKDLLSLINEYSLELANIETEDIFNYTIHKLQDFLDAKSVHYSLYKEDTNELIVQNTSMSDKNRKVLKQIANFDIIGYSIKLSPEQVANIIEHRVTVMHTLTDLTFGKIPLPISKIIQETFDIGWVLAIALTQNEKLIGTLVIVDKEKTEAPNKELLLAFAGVTTTSLSKKKIEDNLRDSKKRLTQYLDNSPDGILITDANRIILDVNPAGSKMVGYSQEELRGRNIKILLPKDEIPVMEQLGDEIISTGESFKAKIRYIKKCGKLCNALISTAMINENNYVSFVKNIDEIINYEQELILAKNKAEESDKLKSAFLANMSHEIRSPMNGIVGFANLLKKENLSKEKKDLFIEIINSNGNQLLLLIDDLLDIAKIEANQIKISNFNCDVKKLLNEIFLQYKNTVNEENIEFINESENSNSTHIYTDRYRLKQILVNLVSNAIKFTKSGFIKFGYKVKGESIVFHVCDSGLGISEEDIAKVFNRFHQIENRESFFAVGTGLGLAISKGLASLLNGNISLKSEMNGGSTFEVTLPLNPSIPLEINPEENCINSKIGKKKETKKVLICEDQIENFLYTKEIIKSANLEYYHAKNGLQAIELVETKSDIGIILMDIKMPLIDGCEATKRIKNNHPKLPIVAQTAYATTEEIKNIKECGFDDYLTKPISPDQFINILSKHNIIQLITDIEECLIKK